MKIACATDNKVDLTNNHFGDAEYYNIYDISNGILRYVKSIKNNIVSKVHPDPSKAVKILELLDEEKVEILINKAFGANIKIIKKYVIPVLIKVDTIEEALSLLAKSYYTVTDYMETKKDFYLIMKKEEEVRLVEIT